jgi:hypothetical protein
LLIEGALHRHGAVHARLCMHTERRVVETGNENATDSSIGDNFPLAVFLDIVRMEAVVTSSDSGRRADAKNELHDCVTLKPQVI